MASILTECHWVNTILKRTWYIYKHILSARKTLFLDVLSKTCTYATTKLQHTDRHILKQILTQGPPHTFYCKALTLQTLHFSISHELLLSLTPPPPFSQAVCERQSKLLTTAAGLWYSRAGCWQWSLCMSKLFQKYTDCTMCKTYMNTNMSRFFTFFQIQQIHRSLQCG